MKALVQRYRVSDDPLRTERRVEAVVLLVLALLVLQLLWGLVRFILPGTADPVVPNAESLQVTSLLGAAEVSAEEREEITRRPLFWDGRTPVAVAAQAAAGAEAKPAEQKLASLDGVKLAGIFGAGQEAGIIVINKGKKQRLSVGQDINGWTLDSVDPTLAVLSSGGRQAQLKLELGVPAATQKAPRKGTAGTRAPKQGRQAPQKKQNNDNKQGQQSENQESAPPVPETLGLGGGDRNRGKTNR